MNRRKCRRCGQVEAIPADQAVECLGEPLLLCKACWEEFRNWFYEQPKDEMPALEVTGAR